MLTIALPKGRLADQTLDLMEKAGYDVSAARDKSRKTYVEYGAADIGVVGKDTLLEEGRQLYEVLDLGLGKCRMCVAGPAELKDKFDEIPNKRVGTKYPNITRNYFEGVRGESVEIIKLNGSVELAPLTGLAEVIVDIVESGRTLYENGLDVLETVADISARLVVNRVSMKMKEDEIKPMIAKLKNTLAEEAEKRG